MAHRVATRSAFSLIELVIVTAIIATVAAIAVPRYAQALARYHADNAAQRIKAELLAAADDARFAGASYQVTLDMTTAVFTVTPGSHVSTADTMRSVELGQSPYDATITSCTFLPATPLIFNGYGLANAAANVTLAVGGDTRTVTLDHDSGEVEVSTP